MATAVKEEAREEVVKAIGGIPITKISDSDDYINLLIYGDPGTGKTVFCASAAEVEEMGPILFIDIEGGTRSIRSMFPDIDIIRITEKDGWVGLSNIYVDLREKGVKKYKTIVVDSLTEAHKFSMYYTMGETVKNDPSRDPDIPAQRDWGKGSELFRKMIRSFRDLPCHVLFTAHAVEIKDDSTGKISVLPSLPGKLAREIPGFVDEVFYIYTKPTDEGIQRKILTQPTEKVIAKDRSGRLPTTVSDADMSKVADLVLGQ